MKLKVLELFDDLKIKVSEDGKIYTFNHNVIRKNGICQWTIRKYGREVMPNE